LETFYFKTGLKSSRNVLATKNRIDLSSNNLVTDSRQGPAIQGVGRVGDVLIGGHPDHVLAGMEAKVDIKSLWKWRSFEAD
jgi:hypothetical protein